MNSDLLESFPEHVSVAHMVRVERVSMLYRLTPRTLATAVPFSLAVFFLLYQVVPLALILPWLIANNMVTALRYWDILAYRRDRRAPERSVFWLRRFVGLTALAGTIWGLMGTLLYPADHPEYEAIVTVFMIAVAAVGMFNLNSVWIAFLAMAVPVLMPAAIYMGAIAGGHLGLVLGGTIAAYLLSVVVSSKTSAKNVEEMLMLRFENARIAEQRESALIAAEAAGRAKLQFLANMSHEIRTPLHGIMGMTQLLRATSLSTQQQRWLDTLYSSGAHLLGLLNDVLDFAKVEAGKMDVEFAPFDVRRALLEVTDLLDARAQNRGVNLVTQVATAVPAWVSGDAGRLKQVLNNLIGNAIKFTGSGTITVKVSAEPHAGSTEQMRLQFAVSDTGVGISVENQALLFEPFRQVDASATRRYGGTGLGLSICRHLVGLMGGKIWLESEPGKGSTFSFALDLSVIRAPPIAIPVAGSRTHIPLAGHVLLVEDNPVNLTIAQAMLETLGLSIRTAQDGTEAVATATSEHFDVILMDCQLPEMDGFEATRRILAYERAGGLPHVPIVALTANAIRGDREYCLEQGMDDYISKPFELDQLRDTLQRWLGALP